MGKTAPACYEKLTVVSHADIFVSNESLTTLFSEKLTSQNDKIKNFSVQNLADRAILSGKLKTLVPLSFSISGPVTTDGAMVRLDARTIKADGIPIKALLAMVGEHLSAIFPVQGVPGVTVDGNTMAFSPEKVAHLKGHLLGVSTSDKGLTLHYGR